jgi:hypothetical protein
MADTKIIVSAESTEATRDIFRRDTGNYWNGETYGDPIASDEQIITNITFGTEQVYKLNYPPWFEGRQEIKITGNPAYFKDMAAWKKYVQQFSSHTQSTPFRDFAFDLKALVPKKSMAAQQHGAAYGNVDFIYNFFVRDYEFVTSMPSIPETILPNIYADISNDADNTDPFFEWLMTGAGILPLQEAELTSLMKTSSECRSKGFYQKVAQKLAQTTGTNRMQIARRYANIIFPMENIDILKDIEQYVNIFPMVSKIEFSTDSRTEFAQILKDSKLSSSLLKYISLLVRNLSPSHSFDRHDYITLQSGDRSDMSGNGSFFGIGDFNPLNVNAEVGTAMPGFKLLDWWSAFLNDQIANSSAGNEIFMGDQCQAVLTAKNIQSGFAKILSLLIFAGKIQTLIETHMRSFAEITNGKKCYNETVAYRIAKYKNGATTGTPIQNIWIPNSNDMDIVKYFDSQVKYDREYTYIIFGYNLVIGSLIRYGRTAFTDGPEGDEPLLKTPGDLPSGRGDGRAPAAANTYKGTVIGGGSQSQQDSDTDARVASGNRRYGGTNPDEAPNEILVQSSPSPSSISAETRSAYYKGAIDGGVVANGQLRLAFAAEPMYKHAYDNYTSPGAPGQTPNPEKDGITGHNTGYRPPIGGMKIPVRPATKPDFTLPAPNLDGIDQPLYEAKFVAITRPSLRIIETPLYGRRGRIIDNPPVFPDAYFVALKGHDNKIKINLNTNIGSYLLHPIILDQPYEIEAIQRLRQGKQLPGTMRLRYTTDDPIDRFEIFRTTKLPEKYSDFKEMLHTTVETDVDVKSPQKASAASYVDMIQPNVMYYYMFRCIDRHGHFSNPTSVFSVLMVSNDGIIFPIIKVIQMKPALSPRRNSKPLKKMLNIQPTMGQSIIDYDRTDMDTPVGANGTPVRLGREDEDLFGNKFKIRLTSKKSGKKMDLNVAFKVEFTPQDSANCGVDSMGESPNFALNPVFPSDH